VSKPALPKTRELIVLRMTAPAAMAPVPADIRVEVRRGPSCHLASKRGGRLRGLVARETAGIRVDAVWLAVQRWTCAWARRIRTMRTASSTGGQSQEVLLHDGIG
jgi:hypothetical protein